MRGLRLLVVDDDADAGEGLGHVCGGMCSSQALAPRAHC